MIAESSPLAPLERNEMGTPVPRQEAMAAVDVSDIDAADLSELPTVEDVEARLVGGHLDEAWVFQCIQTLSGVNMELLDSPRGGFRLLDLSARGTQRFLAAGQKCDDFFVEMRPPPTPTEQELRESYDEAVDTVECLNSHGIASSWAETWESYREGGSYYPADISGYEGTPEQDAAYVDCIGDYKIVFDK